MAAEERRDSRDVSRLVDTFRYRSSSCIDRCRSSPSSPRRSPEPTNMDFSIRAANVDDCKDIARMLMELAEYEKVTDKVKISQKDLEQDGFSKNPFFHGIVAEVPEQHKTKEGHTKIGYALYFYSYSSWVGRAIYMEDLYVMPEFRGKGIGKALMSKVAQLGLAADCTQLHFTVLDGNKSSLNFYFSQGCLNLTGKMSYQFMCCEGKALERLAQP
uniref:Spermidine/spermine N1-acetyltransferase family member 2a, tandem duplicate 1 n=1 Tax=Scophthalmus maximus TaxID=52904 RepID=A0A8D3CBU1_SCOMX